MQPGWGNANAQLLLRTAASWQMTAGQVPAVAQEQDDAGLKCGLGCLGDQGGLYCINRGFTSV